MNQKRIVYSVLLSSVLGAACGGSDHPASDPSTAAPSASSTSDGSEMPSDADAGTVTTPGSSGTKGPGRTGTSDTAQ